MRFELTTLTLESVYLSENIGLPWGRLLNEEIKGHDTTTKSVKWNVRICIAGKPACSHAVHSHHEAEQWALEQEKSVKFVRPKLGEAREDFAKIVLGCQFFQFSAENFQDGREELIACVAMGSPEADVVSIQSSRLVKPYPGLSDSRPSGSALHDRRERPTRP